MDAFSISISLGLQHGVSLATYVRKYSNMKFEPAGLTDDADLRLANLLVEAEHLRIIDFDDCGFSWFMYDFATAVSFIEHEPIVPELLRAWCSGYRQVAPLSAEEIDEIATFVVLRRIVLSAWLASHNEVQFARQFGAAYTHGTVTIAQEYLSGQFLRAAPAA